MYIFMATGSRIARVNSESFVSWGNDFQYQLNELRNQQKALDLRTKAVEQIKECLDTRSNAIEKSYETVLENIVNIQKDLKSMQTEISQLEELNSQGRLKCEQNNRHMQSLLHNFQETQTAMTLCALGKPSMHSMQSMQSMPSIESSSCFSEEKQRPLKRSRAIKQYYITLPCLIRGRWKVAKPPKKSEEKYKYGILTSIQQKQYKPGKRLCIEAVRCQEGLQLAESIDSKELTQMISDPRKVQPDNYTAFCQLFSKEERGGRRTTPGYDKWEVFVSEKSSDGQGNEKGKFIKADQLRKDDVELIIEAKMTLIEAAR